MSTHETVLATLARIVGEDGPDGLRRSLERKLGRTDGELDDPGIEKLILEDAKSQGFAFVDLDELLRSPEALETFAAAWDQRVPLVRRIWTYLGEESDLLPSHNRTIARLHEDERFVGKPAPPVLTDAVLNVIKGVEPETSADDLDMFMAGDQPSPFFYEMVLSRLEECESDLDSIPGKEDKEEEEVESYEDEDDAADSSEPVRATVKTFNVEHLFALVKAGRLDLQPPWQRKDVWSLKKKRQLIHSLLLGIPLPSIILHKRGQQMSIIDGKQRLSSIVQFMKNEYKLPSFDVPVDHVLYDCRGARYDSSDKKSIPAGVRTDFGLREIPILLFEEVPERRLRQVFHLYNVSGTRLNAAEIRNAVYQSNTIHRIAYILAGETPRPIPDLDTGNYEGQLLFTERLRNTLPRTSRYAVLDFLCRYLGYSRATQKDASQPFRPASTATCINRFFDYESAKENPITVAREIMEVFDRTEQWFDIDDERLPFHRRNESGQRKFNALIGITNMVAARYLLHAIEVGATSEVAVQEAVRAAQFAYPENQQSATIWDYQARVLTGLRDSLGSNTVEGPWTVFFEKMESVLLPESGRSA